MFNKIYDWIKGVLVKMGLASELQSVSNHKKVMVDDEQYIAITQWFSIYQGKPAWQRIHKGLPDNTYLDRKMLSLNMGTIAAKKMASLVFNQKAIITVSPQTGMASQKPSSPDDAQSIENKFVQQVLKDNHFYNNFERYLEYMFATGGIVIRLYTDNGKVKIRFATADAFYPITSDANGVSECVVASKFMSDNQNYTLLEWHEETSTDYVVTNEIYKSSTNSSSDLGTKILDWSSLPDSFKNMAPQTTYSKKLYSQPTFIYLKPNLANNLNIESPLGVPIYVNAIDTLRQLDEAYDMLWQEFVKGKRRIVAPINQLQRDIDKNGNPVWGVDWSEDVYLGYNTIMSSGDGEQQKPTDITLGLRNETIVAGINNLLHFYSSQLGFSSDMFTFDSKQGQITATAVISENSDTYQTKNSHETLIAEAIEHMCQVIVELAHNDLSVAYTGSTAIDTSVNFDDSIAKDRDDNLNYYMKANGNKPVMTQLEAIKRAFGMTDVEAQQMLDQINAESANAEGDIADVVGGNGKDGEGNA